MASVVEHAQRFVLDQPVPGALVVLCAVAAAGLALGNIKVRGVGLSVAGVLFAGLATSAIGIRLDRELLHFLREFGLILFVYAIGLQVGPGIAAALKRGGLRLNALAVGIVLSGALLAYLIALATGMNPAAAAGLLAGATTNTPSLAAAQQALHTLTPPTVPDPTAATALVDARAGSAYAIAYPFGILGCILALLLVRPLTSRLGDSGRRQASSPLASLHDAQPPEWRNLEVRNASLVGLPLSSVPGLDDLGRGSSGLVISRMMHRVPAPPTPPAPSIPRKDDAPEATQPAPRPSLLPHPRPPNEPFVPTGDEILRTGDVLLAVGQRPQLDRLTLIVGGVSDVDLHQTTGDAGQRLVARRVVVTRRRVVGRTLADLDLTRAVGATVTRVSRAGVEFTPRPDHTFAYADSVLAVGTEDALARLVKLFGDAPARLNHPFLVPYFLGIALGVGLGVIPIALPGLPGAVKLGLAGGPLLVAILVSNLARIGPLIWYVPLSANFMMREFGIVLFLACVGLMSGDAFLAALRSGEGLRWLALGAVITILPLILGALVATRILGLPAAQANGVLAGSMTDPPALALATQLAGNDSPAAAYATVYPISMLLRIVCAQVLVMLLL